MRGTRKHGDRRIDELREALDLSGTVQTLSLIEAAAVAKYEIVRESDDAALVRVLEVAEGHGVGVEPGGVWIAKKARAPGDEQPGWEGVNLIDFAAAVMGPPSGSDVIDADMAEVRD